MTMKIREAIKNNKMICNVDRIRRCSCVNVHFVNNNGKEDETQLTITHNILTKQGTIELEELFGSLAKELNTSLSSVTDIAVVASADTEDLLLAAGF